MIVLCRLLIITNTICTLYIYYTIWILYPYFNVLYILCCITYPCTKISWPVLTSPAVRATCPGNAGCCGGGGVEEEEDEGVDGRVGHHGHSNNCLIITHYSSAALTHNAAPPPPHTRTWCTRSQPGSPAWWTHPPCRAGWWSQRWWQLWGRGWLSSPWLWRGSDHLCLGASWLSGMF